MNNNLGFRMMPRVVRRKTNINKKIDYGTNRTVSNMKWGTVTWKLFHWISANIDEDFYKRKQYELHNIIKNILHNLPCPTCKKHAVDFLRTYDISKAKSKDQFIQYFYFFHNIVNDRRLIVNPNRIVLDDYKKMNGVPVINNWYKDFKNNLGINLNDFMNKQKIAKVKNNMLEFLKKNRQYFSNL